MDVTDLIFSVDKSVILHGFHLFGAPDVEYSYTVVVAKVTTYYCYCKDVTMFYLHIRIVTVWR